MRGCHIGLQRAEKGISDQANGILKMKLKITIIGPKVYDVGYRYFLLAKASRIKLKGFEAFNQIASGVQQVEVLVEGDEGKVVEFISAIQADKPPGSEVSDISSSSYEGEVMNRAEYSSWCTNVQLNKGIQAILGINKTLERMDSHQESIAETQKETAKILECIDNRQEAIAATQENTARILESVAERLDIRLGGSRSRTNRRI
jgi:acylphosphatase